MLGSLDKYGRVFVEVTSLEHEHGGRGWEFGTCLWSPTQTTSGQDRYSLMREPQPGQLVLHIAKKTWESGDREFRLIGLSVVADRCQKILKSPPNPGVWADRAAYYRIDLEGYQPLPTPIRIPAFLDQHQEKIRTE